MDKIKTWFYKPAFTLICYTIALLLFIYCAYLLKLSYDTITATVAAGSITWADNFDQIISYSMEQNLSYIFYAFSFVFFGKVISVIKPRTPKQEVIEDSMEEIIEDVDEELVEA